MTLRALAILHGHRDELLALLRRMEPDHIAIETIRARVREAEEALRRG